MKGIINLPAIRPITQVGGDPSGNSSNSAKICAGNRQKPANSRITPGPIWDVAAFEERGLTPVIGFAHDEDRAYYQPGAIVNILA